MQRDRADQARGRGGEAIGEQKEWPLLIAAEPAV